MTSETFPNSKTVYGPVTSWRFGESLGIDPIFETSTCSFNCFYCQLGHFQNITTLQRVYVPTEKVLKDFKEALDSSKKIDVITYSGSGEPTLASNLGEIVLGIRKLAPEIPQFLLTNGTQFHLDEVKENIKGIDKIIFKLDALTEKEFQLINRPAPGVTLKLIKENIKTLKENYTGDLEIQTMFMPLNSSDLKSYSEFIAEVKPKTVQLNTPKRPYPLSWHRENRGNHNAIFDYEVRDLRTVSQEEASDIEKELRQNTSAEIISIYRN